MVVLGTRSAASPSAVCAWAGVATVGVKGNMVGLMKAVGLAERVGRRGVNDVKVLAGVRWRHDNFARVLVVPLADHAAGWGRGSRSYAPGDACYRLSQHCVCPR